MDVASRLKELRTQREYSVYKLAKLSEISATYIHEIEDGKKQPTVEVLSRLCSALGITLADFFADDASNNIRPELRELLVNAKVLTPEQLQALNEFIKTLSRQS